jgi:hypothetical protein
MKIDDFLMVLSDFERLSSGFERKLSAFERLLRGSKKSQVDLAFISPYFWGQRGAYSGQRSGLKGPKILRWVRWIDTARRKWCEIHAQRVVIFASKTGFLKQCKVQRSKGKSLDCVYFAYVIINTVATIYPKSR